MGKKELTLYSTDTHFDASTTAFENIVGKGEIARDEQFLLFPQCFRLNQIIVSPFDHIFNFISLFAAEFEEPKVGISCKGLKENANILLKMGGNFHSAELTAFNSLPDNPDF